MLLRLPLRLTLCIGAISCVIAYAYVHAPVARAAEPGGDVLTNTAQGPYGVTVSVVRPATLPGQMDVLCVITKAHTSEPVRDARIAIVNTMPGMAMAETDQFTATADAQPGTYRVKVPVTMDGTWTLGLTITSALGQTTFPVSVTVEKPTPPWGLIIAGGVVVPVGVTAIYVLIRRKRPHEDDVE